MGPSRSAWRGSLAGPQLIASPLDSFEVQEEKHWLKPVEKASASASSGPGLAPARPGLGFVQALAGGFNVSRSLVAVLVGGAPRRCHGISPAGAEPVDSVFRRQEVWVAWRRFAGLRPDVSRVTGLRGAWSRRPVAGARPVRTRGQLSNKRLKLTARRLGVVRRLRPGGRGGCASRAAAGRGIVGTRAGGSLAAIRWAARSVAYAASHLMDRRFFPRAQSRRKRLISVW